MSKEQKISHSEDAELSPSLTRLQALHNRILTTQQYLSTTFFQDDTWLVRQAGAYGIPLLTTDRQEEPDWQKEEAFVSQILAELDKKVSYFEAAYRFPDNLSAHVVSTTLGWAKMVAEQDAISIDQAAEKLIEGKLSRLSEKDIEFEQFLESEEFANAFSIRIDRAAGTYQITDLHLNHDEIRSTWKQLFTTE